MKAHIVREPRCVLLWRVDADTPGYDALQRIARANKVKLRCVADGDLGALVGDLCAGRPAPDCAPLIAVPDTPALILSGLRHDNGELSAFLDTLKTAGFAVPVRCMVTPTNKSWTLAQLLTELAREHEAVTGKAEP